MPSSRRSAKRKRRSQTTQTPVTKPPDLGGRIMWLPKLGELSTPSGLPDACHDHPVVLLSPKPLPNNEVIILMVTSFGSRDLITRHRYVHERWKRAHYLPIDPSPAHPDNPGKNVVLKLGGGAVLRKKSWVNTETQHRVVFSLLRNYDWWKTEKEFVLTPESYKVLTDFVRFRADDVVTGPSGTPQLEPEPAMTQTATPPLTPQIRPVVVSGVVPEPVTQLPDVVEPVTAHDSDSDTTVVAEDYWEAEMRRLRDQVFSQRLTIIREGNGSNPSVFMVAHRASYTTPAAEEVGQQPHRPVSQLQDNERSSLLRLQTQATTSNPHGSQISRGTRAGYLYGTLPSSSSHPAAATYTPKPQGQARSRIQNPATAAAAAQAGARVTVLERRRPKHTWYSRLALPFRFDFVFFGISSEQARARPGAFARAIAASRAQAGLGPGRDTTAVWGGRLVHVGLTRAQRRHGGVEGPAYEYARIAPSEGQGEGKGQLSMLATCALILVVLLVQATLLAAVVWSFVHFGADKTVVDLVARTANVMVQAWETTIVPALCVVEDFLILSAEVALWLCLLAAFAYCCGYRGICDS
ncbi:hypothetical protein QBC32DRAFT_244260 [Pseudoneurospora amorphoporcata]|uniref:Uncharacterized protein n=1 Tax=Pseudoneurospora amorphoporcata TaxID=241081 RepID=A0AAN6NNJ9_9PEZI|nr:hypothetical protein QBC32DRAFT_244260 [Pseudoneurospora amorphoporcata]